MQSSSIEEFFPYTENVKFFTNILKTQGVEVCQNKLEKQWTSKALSSYSHGKVYITQKAQIGRRSLKRNEDKYLVQGFILCRMDENRPEIATIDVVCSRENSKVGHVLMEMMEEYCKNTELVKLIQLLCLPEARLKKWYENLGFHASEITIWDGKKPKAYLMQKFL
jgi:hypothetical protein